MCGLGSQPRGDFNLKCFVYFGMSSSRLTPFSLYTVSFSNYYVLSRNREESSRASPKVFQPISLCYAYYSTFKHLRTHSQCWVHCLFQTFFLVGRLYIHLIRIATPIDVHGGRYRIRTCDPSVNSRLRYRYANLP